ncbi:MAG TPA: beta-eliminating lyase-related protein, partial [Actinomycetota bacterium]|nr:beta-eliminating lyase-related protein [Actinomycetota bacterium]
AEQADVPAYLDGARIFNAAVASGTRVGEYAAEVDAMMLSLSKGLGAPIGSVLCGSDPFIQEARRVKILFGGAWRQAGVVAAAGLVALDEGPRRLEEDHANAKRLAEGIADATPNSVDPGGVETNIVFVDTAPLRISAVDLMTRLREQDLLANVVAGKIRFVTHRDVSAGDIDRAIAAWQTVTSDLTQGRHE